MDQPDHDLARFQSLNQREAAADARDTESVEGDRLTDEHDRAVDWRDDIARARGRAYALRIKVDEQIQRRVELLARSREILDRLLRRLNRIDAARDAPAVWADRERVEVESAKADSASLGSADVAAGNDGVPAARVRVPSRRRARPAAGRSGAGGRSAKGGSPPHAR
ncbi:hypothetical protein [Amycolatopsis sp. WQ 127309]|uniref:hypothetical protein n=1 Tax=Amycolatopsis sp. WQ 127309 TaxID=2932773 RepID=UPI001FF31214|nr:hypothetical protein [Amycolatopsis sp. WQ 127309]UOZ07496.1 hypothetical protein MUY22_04155 [Amycolatopsis sp. WQ 127309]